MSFLAEMRAAAIARLSELPEGEPRRLRNGDRFEAALRQGSSLAVIAEIKERSPSRGDFADALSPNERARRYADAGAAAISVVTEPTRFGGSLERLTEVRHATTTPLLMKDFVVSTEQLRVAALLGADAVLLIARLLDDALLHELLRASRRLGLAALVECHDEAEIVRACRAGARVIGVNNRDLETLRIDTSRAPRLLRGLRPGFITVAESGYATAQEASALRDEVDAVLMGTALMLAEDPGLMIREVVTCTSRSVA